MVTKVEAWSAEGQIFSTEEAAQAWEDKVVIGELVANLDTICTKHSKDAIENTIEVLAMTGIDEDRWPNHARLIDKFVGVMIRRHGLAYRYDPGQDDDDGGLHHDGPGVSPGRPEGEMIGDAHLAGGT